MNERTKYIDTRFGGNAADSLLQNEIDALDVEVKAEEERAKKEEKRLDEKIDAETERATSEEQRIEGRLDEEIDRAKSEEKRIEDKLDAEIERSIAEDERLDHKIDDETARAQGAERALDEKIDAETERAQEAERVLDGKIDKEIEDRIIDVDNEEAERMAADEALDQKIDKEIQDRIDDVDAEEAARIAADAAEAQAREEADIAEAAARVLGDEHLQDQIDAIEARTDVVDVVSCYDKDNYEEPKPETDLVHYDTSTLSDNDVVKVLIDETHNDAVSYYRWVITSASGEPTEGEWVFIGSVEAYYTKAETDAIAEALQEQIDKDIEVVEYQTTTPLTEKQLAKAQSGKLAILKDGKLYLLQEVLNNNVYFIYRSTSSAGGSKFTSIERLSSYRLKLTASTKLLSSSGSSSQDVISDSLVNAQDADIIPDASGKQIIRALNLRKTQDMIGTNYYDATATYALGDTVIYQNVLYKCTTAIPTAEAWNASHWTQISISERLDNTASELEILRLFREECTITSNITNGSASGDSTIWTEETASVTIVPSSGYVLPETVTVSGATYSYDGSTGVVSLSAATGAVTITGECTPTIIIIPPNKGDIITLDGGTARYRVLGVSGNEALLLAMDDYTSSAYNSSSVTKTFDGGKTGQKYEGSTLDNLLNTTYYNSLSSNVRNAIVDQTRIQRMYAYKNPDDPSYDYHQQYNFDATKMRGLPIEDQTTVGSRHVFALDVKDIFDYLGKDTMTSAELNEMFFEQTTYVSKNVWLSSADSDISDNAFRVRGDRGYVNYNSYNNSYVVRPAFQIDLSKVTWAKETNMPEKGDIIKLDGGTARYRVLKTNGNVAEVMALDDVTNSTFNNSSVTTTFSDGSTGQKYENSTLDTYMNSTFYNSLSANIKAAIVQKAVTQSIYQFGSSEISGYDFAITRITSGNRWYKRGGQVSVGNRYCYALDLDDVAEYLGAGSGNTVSGANLNDMFFEQTTATSKYVWLDSAYSDNSAGAFNVYGYTGFVGGRNCIDSTVARPAFQVDLSNLSWAKEE